jgi:NAD(P)-dependent dehydrogenase (short-subunit alcohol dehydrogenase family)/pimeloyl-ACP methyl ester carboxylesterase
MSKQKTVLITGASSGFGRALFDAALNAGHTVVGTVRRVEDRDALKALSSDDRALAFVLDVTDFKAIDDAVTALEKRVGSIDVLINSAGYGHEGVLEESSLEELRRQLDVNLFGAVAMIKAVLPSMRKRRRGHIINITSMAGYVGLPGIAYYAASKFALEGVSDVLAKEVASFGIKVTAVAPGSFRTEWAGRSMVRSPRSIADYDELFNPIRKAREDKSGKQNGDPEIAALVILDLLSLDEPPSHLVLGSDALDLVKPALRTALDKIDIWEQVSRSTDFNYSKTRRNSMHKHIKLLTSAAVALGIAAGGAAKAAPITHTLPASPTVFYRSVSVDGISIFYREAGRPDAPTILLLHGFPSSSRMYEPLLTRLSAQYHLIAPDYPGFGHSDAPGNKEFSYTFDHISQVMQRFTEVLGLQHYVLFMQDYGGPVGFRMAIAHPERVQAFIIQNACAHEEGLSPLWQKRREFWADRAANEPGLRANFSSLAATRQRHIGSNPTPETIDPDRWNDEFAFLSRPGEDDIQIDLFYDYRTNVASYPAWGAWLRQHQPATLVIWGKYDPSFVDAEAAAYQRDLPKAEVHILDAGHFALYEKPDEIAGLVSDFLRRTLGG